MTNVPSKQSGDREVCVIKRTSDVLTDSTVRKLILFFPVIGSALQTLYLALKNVYTPRLSDRQGLDHKTTQALSELEKGLHRALVQVTCSITKTHIC